MSRDLKEVTVVIVICVIVFFGFGFLAYQNQRQQEREKHGCKVGHTTYSCPEGIKPTEEFHCDERYPEAPQPP